MKCNGFHHWLLGAALVTLPAGLALAQEHRVEEELGEPATAAHWADTFREDFSYSVGFGFESMLVLSGSQAAYATFVPSLDLEYRGIYFSLIGLLPLNSDNQYCNEYDLSLGYTLELGEIVSLSLGGTYYWYPDNLSPIARTRELNTAVAFNVLLSPTIVFNYDFDLQQREFILCIGHEFDLSASTGVDGLLLAAELAYGYINTEDTTAGGGPKESDGYGYAEAVVNIIYAASDSLKLYVGPRYAYNNNGKHRNMDDREQKVWVGAGASWNF